MKEQLLQMISDSIESWSDTDIYAVSLCVHNKRDDPCMPTVKLSYNTGSRVQTVLSGKADDVYGMPCSESEARWNYAFWLQNSFFVFGDGDTQQTVRDWIISSGLPYYEYDDPAWDEDETYDEVEQVTEAFVDELIDTVRELHRQKILTKKFGRELPVIIHKLEYYKVTAMQNIAANGKALVSEFAEWCGF